MKTSELFEARHTLCKELIEKYEIVRSALIAGAAVDTAIYRRYNELFRLLVPAQIIEKIYTPLITK